MPEPVGVAEGVAVIVLVAVGVDVDVAVLVAVGVDVAVGVAVVVGVLETTSTAAVSALFALWVSPTEARLTVIDTRDRPPV